MVRMPRAHLERLHGLDADVEAQVELGGGEVRWGACGQCRITVALTKG
jgi:hypothetical protein